MYCTLFIENKKHNCLFVGIPKNPINDKVCMELHSLIKLLLFIHPH
jgi:hypothetical protein